MAKIHVDWEWARSFKGVKARSLTPEMGDSTSKAIPRGSLLRVYVAPKEPLDWLKVTMFRLARPGDEKPEPIAGVTIHGNLLDPCTRKIPLHRDCAFVEVEAKPVRPFKSSKKKLTIRPVIEYLDLRCDATR